MEHGQTDQITMLCWPHTTEQGLSASIWTNLIIVILCMNMEAWQIFRYKYCTWVHTFHYIGLLAYKFSRSSSISVCLCYPYVDIFYLKIQLSLTGKMVYHTVMHNECLKYLSQPVLLCHLLRLYSTWSCSNIFLKSCLLDSLSGGCAKLVKQKNKFGQSWEELRRVE